MNEKILIKSEKGNAGVIFIIFLIIGALISLILFSDIVSYYGERYDDDYQRYLKHRNEYCYQNTVNYLQQNGGEAYLINKAKNMTCGSCQIVEKYPSSFDYSIAQMEDEEIVTVIVPVAAFAFIGGLIYFWLHSYELTVTDKRVFGKVVFGRRVDLPIDSVSATATSSLLKGISISTSSGRISFLYIKNADEIYTVLNNLLIERQQQKVNTITTETVYNTDETEQLKKYKELLDSGIITQEEFNEKKKQLLGI